MRPTWQRFNLWQVDAENIDGQCTYRGQFDTLKEAYERATSLRLPAWDIVRAGAVVATSRVEAHD